MNNEQVVEQDEVQFSGILSCLNDGVSPLCQVIIGCLLISLISCGFFIVKLSKPLGIGFIILSTLFSVSVVAFLYLYQPHNPQIQPKAQIQINGDKQQESQHNSKEE